MLIVQLADLNQSTIDFSLLSQEIIDESKKFNESRQKQFLVCRSILASLLKQYYAISMLPPIIIGNNNRPTFFDTNLPDFNISHSKNKVAVAISSTGKIGVDVEVSRERKNYLNVAKHCFSNDEQAWMLQQLDTLSAFWQLWTLKESALKLYAKGVWQMKSININVDKQLISAPFGEHFYYQYHQIGGLHLSVNCNQPIDDFMLLPN